MTTHWMDAGRKTLAGIQFFEGMEEGSRSTLIGSFNFEEIPPGAAIFHEAETNTRLYVMLGGLLEVRLPMTARREEAVRVATVQAGEVFGEYSIFDGRPVSATVAAIQLSHIAWIEKVSLDAFVDGHSAAGRCVYDNLVRVLIERLREKTASLDERSRP
ncbi:MAG: CRP-like cAMP-binding protein [Hyphomicrobiaceae bacterium]|jgi:CRP-like cAMP-binding protein